MGKLFVWDFHGTLEKGNDGTVIEIINAILKRHGYAVELDEKKAAEMTGKHWWEYFSQLIPGLPEQHYMNLEVESVAEFEARPERMLKYIQPNDHAHEVLEALTLKHTQIIISQIHQRNLPLFLKATGITKFFPQGHHIGIVDEGKTKKKALQYFMNGRKYDAVVAIGDSPHDMLGHVNYLYAHPGRQHRSCDAHYKINNLLDILREV